MLQQIKQIEEFFRNDTCEGEQMRYPAQQYEMKEAVNDSHSSKEVEMLKKEIASLRKELAGTKHVIVSYLFEFGQKWDVRSVKWLQSESKHGTKVFS